MGDHDDCALELIAKHILDKDMTVQDFTEDVTDKLTFIKTVKGLIDEQ